MTPQIEVGALTLQKILRLKLPRALSRISGSRLFRERLLRSLLRHGGDSVSQSSNKLHVGMSLPLLRMAAQNGRRKLHYST